MLAARSSSGKPSLDVEIPILNATGTTNTGVGGGADNTGSSGDDAVCRICAGEGVHPFCAHVIMPACATPVDILTHAPSRPLDTQRTLAALL